MGRYRIDIEQLSYVDCPNIILKDIHLSLDTSAFTIIAGKSGCGKTTLLRMLKHQIQPQVTMRGNIMWEEEEVIKLSNLDAKHSAGMIGYVSQYPDAQLVSDEVWHEIAFGLENQGIPSNEIHARIAEIVSFLGLEDIYHRSISQLSGGQKQMVHLASVLVMRPNVLLLDEPVSQLDPIARQHFYDLLLHLHQEYNIGIIMVEHTLEPVLQACDRILYLQDGYVIYDGDARHLHKCMISEHALLPYPARYIKEHMTIDACYLTIQEMKQIPFTIREREYGKQQKTTPVLQCSHAYFRYQKEGEEILRDVAITLYQHEIVCLLGGNGSGKTTLLKMLASKKATAFGNITKEHRILYLPQDPRILFLKDTLEEEYQSFKTSKEREQLYEQFQLTSLLHQHPYDLSGGEIQRAALALLLLQIEEQVIFFLDEPSKGLDMQYREQLAKIMKQLAQTHTVFMVSHDVEFAALCADRCGMMFDGEITALQPTRAFFAQQYFYTTYWHRVTRHLKEVAYRYEDIL